MLQIVEFPWWVLLLMVMGLIGLGTLILNLFSAIGDRPSDARQVGSCPLDSIDFLLALAGVINAPLHRGGTAKLLNNGDEFYPAMLEAIRNAEVSVNFATYIWQNGTVSEQFFEALIERARAGVEVRVLVDGIGAFRVPRDRVRDLEQAGATWKFFNFPRFGRLTRLHKRTHRRALVIDGKIGFTGGAAVMDKWQGSARTPDEW